jgi:hypothetical protein
MAAESIADPATTGINCCAGARPVRCNSSGLPRGVRANMALVQQAEDAVLDIALKFAVEAACALVVIYVLVWKS